MNARDRLEDHFAAKERQTLEESLRSIPSIHLVPPTEEDRRFEALALHASLMRSLPQSAASKLPLSATVADRRRWIQTAPPDWAAGMRVVAGLTGEQRGFFVTMVIVDPSGFLGDLCEREHWSDLLVFHGPSGQTLVMEERETGLHKWHGPLEHLINLAKSGTCSD